MHYWHVPVFQCREDRGPWWWCRPLYTLGLPFIGGVAHRSLGRRRMDSLGARSGGVVHWHCADSRCTRRARHLACQAVMTSIRDCRVVTQFAPNNALKPKLHRYAVNMAETACHVASYALQFGLT